MKSLPGIDKACGSGKTCTCADHNGVGRFDIRRRGALRKAPAQRCDEDLKLLLDKADTLKGELSALRPLPEDALQKIQDALDIE